MTQILLCINNILKKKGLCYNLRKNNLEDIEWSEELLCIILFAIVTGVFRSLYKNVGNGYNVIIKVLFIFITFLFMHFVVGCLLLYISRVYKYLYKIEDKNTKTNLLINYFIISMYMTILIIFPRQFGENYKIVLVGVAISYILALKVLMNIWKSSV